VSLLAQHFPCPVWHDTAVSSLVAIPQHRLVLGPCSEAVVFFVPSISVSRYTFRSAFVSVIKTSASLLSLLDVEYQCLHDKVDLPLKPATFKYSSYSAT